MTKTDSAPRQNVIVFDGVCNLCHAAVRFVLKYEATPRYQFAAVQSTAGEELLMRHGLNPADAESFLLIRDGQAFTHSSAAFELCRDLPRWRWLRHFRWLPLPIRDAGYRLIARHRYRLFGKKAVCELRPAESDPATQARFCSSIAPLIPTQSPTQC